MMVLLIILILFVLLCITPVGAKVIYSAEGPKISVKAGPLSIPVFPRPEKEKTEKQLAKEEKKAREKAEKKAAKAEEKKRLKEEKKKAKKEAKKAAKGKKSAAGSGSAKEAKPAEKAAEPEKPKQPLGGKIAFFKELLGIGLNALACIKRKLILKDLVLYLTVGGKGDDAAKAALLYGRAWAAVGALTPVLENTFNIRNRDIQVGIDFFAEDNVIYAEACILFRIGDILWIAVYHGIRALTVFLKQKRKGRMKNGTSHQ